MTFLERLKRIWRKESRRERRPRRRRDPSHVGRSSAREIEQAPPERAGELAGHAVERVDT
jgi:hypothetical protein